jgi:hypothetical protein
MQSQSGDQLARLRSNLDIYLALEAHVHDRGEAYPGESAIIEKNIRCLAKVIDLQLQQSGARG